ncbi:MAG: hypothetical protein JWQ98_1610 [Chlorobi bacterium]|nr:hypothetical protein [Chlorobiota bacterium]
MMIVLRAWLRISFVAAFLALGSQAAFADWTAVRELVRQGDRLTDDSQQEAIYRRAYVMAQSSLASNPKSSNEYLWVANAAGRLAMVAPTGERIKLSKIIKDNAERAIALDSRNGAAYMVLGAWHFYVADLSWFQKNAAKAFYGGLPPASYQDAVKYLSLALTLGVENPVEVYYIRGRAYEELDNQTAAKSDYTLCIQRPARNAQELDVQQSARKRLN